MINFLKPTIIISLLLSIIFFIFSAINFLFGVFRADGAIFHSRNMQDDEVTLEYITQQIESIIDVYNQAIPSFLVALFLVVIALIASIILAVLKPQTAGSNA